jgi:4-amino-4-deoxy-L-arabinose transferase-like glycosyltransferase
MADHRFRMKELTIRNPQSAIRNWFKLTFAIGALLILAGIFVSSPTLVEFLRATPAHAELLKQLLLGATLFRIGLVILGLLVIILGRMPLWNQSRMSNQDRRPGTEDRSSVFGRPSSFGWLVVILLAAFALRLYGLNSGLWHDEILTYVKYARLPFGEIISTYEDQNQHFLYTVLAHASFRIFGESAWSLRLPAVLFGVASIWALYLLGRQVSTEREALLSVALFTFSYHHIWFSQNARGYMGLLFWTIFASWLLLRGLRESRPHLWLLYAGAAALGVYTNTAMLFVIISHFIIYLWSVVSGQRSVVSGQWSAVSGSMGVSEIRHPPSAIRHPNRWAGFLLGFCLAGFLTLLLHALALPQMLGGLVGEESTVPAWKHPLWAFLEFVNAMKISFAGGVVAVGALLVFGVGLWSFARTNPVVVQLLIIPALICAAVVVGMGHHLWPRLFFFTFGFSALVVIRGTMSCGQMATRLLNLASAKSIPIGTAFCMGLVLVSAMSLPLAYAPKQDFQGALDFVEARKEPGDAIVTVGLATFTYKNFYKKDWEEVETLEALNSIRSRAKRTWLLYTFLPHVQSVYPEIMASIQHDFKVEKEFYGTVGSGTIFVCRSDAPPLSLVIGH